jgi:hypothetical protein
VKFIDSSVPSAIQSITFLILNFTFVCLLFGIPLLNSLVFPFFSSSKTLCALYVVPKSRLLHKYITFFAFNPIAAHIYSIFTLFIF